ncbi:MFS transporter [Tenuibacillus multivorans]|uniref:Predicted arabinose efflux permease, MFS family n=1 Tax=Tenuibacillus multivorans TaxID=237069 RepID=A0A1G9YN56_9BACI|nr:MFS transporter [Tenuibacillus multivorans]GEL78462.1 permease [Tenuibacillus multivorans]SDN10005.1 Predicted arabinose efflux permease, MFS family [Tenuibacillus multivorans]
MIELITIKNILGPFKYKSFSLLTLGGTLSRIGSSAAQATLIWYIISNNTASFLGLFLALYWCSRILAQLFTGVFVDNFDRSKAMILGDIIGGTLFIVVALMVYMDMGTNYLLGVYILIGMFSQIYPVASQTVIPDIVPQNELSKANAGLQTSLDGGGIVGPAIGTLLLGAVSAWFVFGLNTLSFMLSAIAVFFARIKSKPIQGGQGKKVINQIKEGLSNVWNIKSLHNIALIGFFLHFAIIPVETVLLSTLIEGVYHFPAWVYGVTVGMINAGSVIFGLILSFYNFKLSSKTMMAITIILEAISFLLLGFLGWKIMIWAIAFIHGGAGTLLFIYVLTIVQESTKTEIRGKAFSAIYLAVEIGSAIGLLVCGILTSYVSLTTILILFSVLALLNIIFIIRIPQYNKKAVQ